jgi:autotransporter-associated beta strand protein
MSMQLLRVALLSSTLAVSAAQFTRAGSATWADDPVSNDWNIVMNWVPNTVPNEANDTAAFATSNITDVTISAAIEVGAILFNPDAEEFDVTTAPAGILTLSGAGVVNNSPNLQTLVANVSDAFTSGFVFQNSATLGQNTLFENLGGEMYLEGTASAENASIVITGAGVRQGHLIFFGNSTAAEAAISVNGFATATFLDDTTAGEAGFTAIDGGTVVFSANSSAVNATIGCSGGTETGRGGGGVDFDTSATAGQSLIEVNGAGVAGAVAASIVMSDSSTCGAATFTVNGGAEAGAEGAEMNFFETATAADASILINGGENGGEGGGLFFFGNSDGGTARLTLSGNAQVDISGHGRRLMTLGSLEGDGSVFLGSRALAIGSKNLSTTFSGVIQDGGSSGGTGGSVTKVGSGTLNLAGSSSYTGGTIVSAGALNLRNKTGSATGSGAVNVNTGTLGGKGIIGGVTTIGTGSASGAFLAPALGTKKQATLTIQNALTFNSDATYTCTFKAKKNKARSDKLIAKGVTIKSGAIIALNGQTQGSLKRGVTLTLISNTSTDPISGSFSNLPEGGIVMVNGSNFQASYRGGDGNDLTLTVVP